MRERDVEDEKERKQEIAKNAKDDSEKKERGGRRDEKGYQRKDALKYASWRIKAKGK